jgi:hypothetical protein
MENYTGSQKASPSRNRLSGRVLRSESATSCVIRSRLPTLGLEMIVVTRDPCLKPLTPKSRSRAEEAQRDGTLILLEKTLQCECGARVGARLTSAGELIPTRHIWPDSPKRRATKIAD